MPQKGKTEPELWAALEGLDDDLLALDMPESAIDEELKQLGADPEALAQKGLAFVAEARERDRLSWQDRARQRRSEMEARASKISPTEHLDREAILARLEELRRVDPKVGTAIKMAARKRKPEESTDEELRDLLGEMEALRSIEGDED